jgi:DNA polymerase IV
MILHIDMDAFFAAVEQRDNPDLRNRPVVVCGSSPRAVVSTASYEARQFGIHSAMPLFQARQRCRHLVVVPGRMAAYAAESRKIMEILSRFTPLVEPVSIDEAYLDVTGCETLFGPPPVLAQKIKQAVFSTLSLTCSIGIAPVKFLAKIASDMNKPDGLTVIAGEQVQEMIRHLPIKKVPGVGSQAMIRMAALNIRTLGDVQRFDPDLLVKKFGKFGHRLYQLCRGMDDARVSPGTPRKSISSETTLDADISDFSSAKDILLALAARVGRDLRKKGLVCCSVFIKVKFCDFTLITRTRKTDDPVCATEAIFHQALRLFRQVPLKNKIRLLGVGVSHLQSENTPGQLDLFAPAGHDTRKQWETVDRALDRICEKFGRDMVVPAVLNPQGKDPLTKGGRMDQTICKKVVVSGKVQGVFFRAETRKAAQKAGVDGYVKNLANGSVEAVFQGTPRQVDQMVAWCRKGPPAARVDRVSQEPVSGLPGGTGFEIRY